MSPETAHFCKTSYLHAPTGPGTREKNIDFKRGLHPMLKYRRFSKQKKLLMDGSRKIKKIPKFTELSYLGKYVFLFLKKDFIFFFFKNK